MWKILFLALCTACLSFVRAADFSADARGTTGAQFLELPVGARAIAMGSAYSSISDDSFSVYYNPAGLAYTARFSAGLMHALYFQDISYDYGVIATPIGKLGVLGVSAQYLAVGQLAEMDKTGVPTGEYIKPSDMALSVTYAKQFGAFGFGLTAKQIKSRIRHVASTFAGDIGLQVRTRKIGLGLSVLNAGNGLKFIDDESSLPTTGRLGVSVLFTPRWLFSVDGIAPKGTNPTIAVGTEYKLVLSKKMELALRAGYNSRYSTSKLGDMAGINAGAGIDFGDLAVDYAWSLYGDLGVTHWFSLNMKLGSEVNRKHLEANGQVPKHELHSNDEIGTAVAVPDVQKTYQDYLEAADDYISQKDYENAAVSYAEALKALPENDKRRIYTLEQQGHISLKLKNIPKAKAFYFAAIQTATKLNLPETIVVNSRLSLAYCFEQSGDNSKAINSYKKALLLSNNAETKVRIKEAIDKLETKDTLLDTDIDTLESVQPDKNSSTPE